MVRKNVAEILTNHVTFELEAIDRMYLNAYVPSLQTGAGFVYFLKTQLGVRVPSTVMVAPMSERFVAGLERFVETQGIDLVTFKKGERKDDVAKQYLATFEGDEGVLFVGKAKRRRGSSARKSGATRRGRRTPGSSARRRWSIITTSTSSIAISVRCSSSSARTFRTPRSSV